MGNMQEDMRKGKRKRWEGMKEKIKNTYRTKKKTNKPKRKLNKIEIPLVRMC